jgi:hypothetical protein
MMSWIAHDACDANTCQAKLFSSISIAATTHGATAAWGHPAIEKFSIQNPTVLPRSFRLTGHGTTRRDLGP